MDVGPYAYGLGRQTESEMDKNSQELDRNLTLCQIVVITVCVGSIYQKIFTTVRQNVDQPVT